VVHVNFVSPDFFATYGTHLLAGREFTVTDRQGAAPVAIVNEAFARKFMDGMNPVGRRVQRDAGPKQPAVSLEIVGYAEDAVYRDLREPLPPTLYAPLAQSVDDFFVSSGVQISVRAATGSPALLTRSVAAALTGVDPDLALTFQPLEDQVRSSLAQERVIALLSGFFGSLALLLAALGLYGVTAYAVSRRRTEIGIRMALGAERDSVVRMVLRRVALLVAAGVLVGTIASLWAATFVDTLLFGLGPRDASTLTGAALVLTAIGLLAGWLPARRASRVDPAAVLREA
jgi:predicted permease